jgi:hypothetical protein
MILRRFFVLGWLLMLSILTVNAAAQTNHVADVVFDQSPWSFRIIYADESGGRTVSAIIGFVSEDQAVGDNIIAVMYLRNSNGAGYADDTWGAKSWQSQDKGAIIASIAQYFNLTNPTDLNQLGSSVSAVNAISAPPNPEDYMGGLLAGDPLALFVAECGDRDAVVSLLTMGGYKAADIPLEKVDDALGCAPAAVLAGMTATTESWLNDAAYSTSVGEDDAPSAADDRGTKLANTYSSVADAVCAGTGGSAAGRIKITIPIVINPGVPWNGPVCNNGICCFWRNVRVFQVRICYANGSFCLQTRTQNCEQRCCMITELVPVEPCDSPDLLCPITNQGWQPACAACGTAVN